MWLQRPTWRLLSASYAGDLALRDTIKCRDLLKSDRFQAKFHPTWKLSPNQNTKGYYLQARKLPCQRF